MVKKKSCCVALALFLIASFLVPTSFAAVEECLLFSQHSSAGLDDSLYCVPYDESAQKLCAENGKCTSSSVIPKSCENIPECSLVTCNLPSTGCQPSIPSGLCQSSAGQIVQASDQAQCNLGCCQIISDKTEICQFGLNTLQCTTKAKELGVSPSTTFDSSLSLQQCSQLCKVQVAGNIFGVVTTSVGKPIAGAIVSLQGTSKEATTLSDGKYLFSGINAASYTLIINANQYLPASAPLQLNPGQSLEKNIVLQLAQDTVPITGTIIDQNSKPLDGVFLTYSGPTTGQIKTNVSGKYQLQLVPGTYSFTLTKAGYQTIKHDLKISITLAKDFKLSPTKFQEISGTTYLDVNNNNVLDNSDSPIYGAKIYINSVFRGYSTYPTGNFQIDVPISSTKNLISASYQNYQQESQEVLLGQKVNILLTTLKGLCSEVGTEKETTNFVVVPVPGEKKINLAWTKPCPEVIGYRISRFVDEKEDRTLDVPANQANFIDDTVQWGKSYSYTITALYMQDRFSKPVSSLKINVGDPLCEGRFDSQNKPITFCLPEKSKSIFSCDLQNKLIIKEECSSGFCGAVSTSLAICKDPSLCSVGSPFGLYASRDLCYGSETKKSTRFCYYDARNTIVNQCNACTTLKNCFDYQTQDACETNNCFSTSCFWITPAANTVLIDYNLINLPLGVQKETGSGYCVEKNYKKDDQCSLCGPTANLFENNFCTAEICSNLGRCFSNQKVTACSACGAVPSKEANCYTYQTKYECSESNQKKTDSCAWNTCVWQGTDKAGQCVKDTDGNGKDDCTGLTGEDLVKCKIDNTPPHSSIISSFVTLSKPTILVTATDEQTQKSQQQNLGVFGYCLAASGNTCTPSIEVPYKTASSKESLVVNIVNAPELKGKKINGQAYTLRYYSKDIYNNKEKNQEIPIFIDNVPPEFTISEEIKENTLSIYLQEASEPLSCEFSLTGLIPLKETQKISTSKNEIPKAVFSNLQGIHYSLNLHCGDNYGNNVTKNKEYIFDRQALIDLIYPPPQGVISANSISFQARTTLGSTCELEQNQQGQWQKIANFQTDEKGLNHQTDHFNLTAEQVYAATYRIICKDLLAQKEFYDYYHFTLDSSPPSTEIMLQEGFHIEKINSKEWSATFVKKAEVTFECSTNQSDGLPCGAIFYCLGSSCPPIPQKSDQEYTKSFIITNSTKICYYNTNKQDLTSTSSVNCGEIFIEGYGITLEKPLPHFFKTEQWGISNNPIFELRFTTKTPTKECRYDAVPHFPYSEVAGFKILKPKDGIYNIPQFPEGTGITPYPSSGGVKTIFVKCQDYNGTLGPEQKINLEYDPNPPQIVSLKATPNPLIEGSKVLLIIETDDKTLCKFSDVDHKNYDMMPYAFPGAESDLFAADGKFRRRLEQTHATTYYLGSFQDLSKTYTISAMCKNGAGDLSLLKTKSFTVDYTKQGSITSLWPQGQSFGLQDLTARVETSKNSQCQIKMDNHYIPLVGGGRIHTFDLPPLVEGFHSLPIRCAMGDQNVDGELIFTIDTTKPIISKLEDGSYSCGTKELTIFSYTGENISSYDYEIYSTGSAISSSSSSLNPFLYDAFSPAGGSLVFVGTINSNTTPNLKIPLINTTVNKTYFVKLRATDLAGNQGDFVMSDGVQVVPQNSSACLNVSVPSLNLIRNESCHAVNIHLECATSIGCNTVSYGLSSSTELCQPTQTYRGEPLSFSENTFICYKLNDNLNQNDQGIKAVLIPNVDGDSILDQCDQCLQTPLGKVADKNGCAAGETPLGEEKDSDSDGLPDIWEENYNSESCPLSHLTKDTNNNGLEDTAEDYDQDSFDNYQEFSQGQNPCEADQETKEKIVVIPTVSSPTAEGSTLATTLLIIGILLLLLGSGYLIYYTYRFSSPSSRLSLGTPLSKNTLPHEQQSNSSKLFDLRKTEERIKERKRTSFFRPFTQSSEEIPHVEKILNKRVPSPDKIQEIAAHYTEHKQEIQPGLRAEEKSIFTKLEKIAQKSSIGKEEAETIFTKLKEITQKRKK